MNVSINLLPSGRIGVESKKYGWADTLEICSTTHNPLISIDYCILVTDVPRNFLEYISQNHPHIHFTDNTRMDRSRCYIHIYSWKNFLRNCGEGWGLNLLHDPCDIFNSHTIELCNWIVERFVSSDIL